MEVPSTVIIPERTSDPLAKHPSESRFMSVVPQNPVHPCWLHKVTKGSVAREARECNPVFGVVVWKIPPKPAPGVIFFRFNGVVLSIV